jgi:hypothetical protein
MIATTLNWWLRLTARCPDQHYDEFLRRSVRCNKLGGHAGTHRYKIFDQEVVWR